MADEDSWGSKLQIVRGQYQELGTSTAEEMYRQFVSEDMERDLDGIMSSDDVQELSDIIETGLDKAEEALQERFPQIGYASHNVLMYVAWKAK